MNLLIISGRSGSGKSVCLKALEDMGYNCTDNLPINLLPNLTETFQHHDRIAVGIDARNLPSKLLHFESYLLDMKASGTQIKIVFLDAEDSTLIKRFSETRRRHPLTHEAMTLPEAIACERSLLAPIASLADITLQTTGMTAHELKNFIIDRVGIAETAHLVILFESFGYKNGLPVDADYVFDMRTLPNPYWTPPLRPLTGLDQPVIDFFEQDRLTQKMYQSLKEYLTLWIPHIHADHRSYLTIAMGCTGGRHRSVYMTEKLSRDFKSTDQTIHTRHRDLNDKMEF
jgi:UPF0042 nucleotide-binding protein